MAQKRAQRVVLSLLLLSVAAFQFAFADDEAAAETAAQGVEDEEYAGRAQHLHHLAC